MLVFSYDGERLMETNHLQVLLDTYNDGYCVQAISNGKYYNVSRLCKNEKEATDLLSKFVNAITDNAEYRDNNVDLSWFRNN